MTVSKRLLEELLGFLEQEQWQWRGEEDGARCIGCFVPFQSQPYDPTTQTFGPDPVVHEPTCTFADMLARLRAAISSYASDPSPESTILCLADQMEDRGDARAELIREIVNATWAIDATKRGFVRYLLDEKTTVLRINMTIHDRGRHTIEAILRGQATPAMPMDLVTVDPQDATGWRERFTSEPTSGVTLQAAENIRAGQLVSLDAEGLVVPFGNGTGGILRPAPKRR